MTSQQHQPFDPGTCQWCQRPLRLFLDPRPGPLRPNFRCDCDGAMNAIQAMQDPEGRIWPESRQWFIDRGLEVPCFEFEQIVEVADGAVGEVE